MRTRFGFESDIGGFIWWTLARFCKTDLSIEQENNNKTRNIVIFYVVAFIITFLSVKIF